MIGGKREGYSLIKVITTKGVITQRETTAWPLAKIQRWKGIDGKVNRV